MAERVRLEGGWVLHRRPYRETSLLLEVLTAGRGRLSLVARGARRPRSAWQGPLQPFRPLLLSWTARGELGTLTGAEPAGPPLPLAGRALWCGLYLNELLVRLLHRHDPHPGLHRAYGEALHGLAAAAGARPERGRERVLRLFELRLLRELGYGLLLDRDAEGAPLAPEGRYAYDPARGPLPLGPGEPAPRGTVPVDGALLLGLHRGRVADAHLPAAKALLRAALGRCLGERPLRSRELFGALPGAAPEAP